MEVRNDESHRKDQELRPILNFWMIAPTGIMG
jgi:hypothetical protein